jgi:hypothetical protein
VCALVYSIITTTTCLILHELIRHNSFHSLLFHHKETFSPFIVAACAARFASLHPLLVSAFILPSPSAYLPNARNCVCVHHPSFAVVSLSFGRRSIKLARRVAVAIASTSASAIAITETAFCYPFNSRIWFRTRYSVERITHPSRLCLRSRPASDCPVDSAKT